MTKRPFSHLRRRYPSIALVVAILIAVGLLSSSSPRPAPATPPLVASTDRCSSQQLTEAAVAAARMISVGRLHQLQSERGLTLSAICAMPDEALESALAESVEADEPRPDHPDDALLFRRLQQQDEHGVIPPDGLIKAARQIRIMQAAQGTSPTPVAGISTNTWTAIGPGNIGGRIRSIVVHPTTPTTIWAGSVGGGIWKTTNGGASWQPLNDFMANLAVATLAIDPANPNILYAGTGEGFYNIDGLQGAGVFKTTDGGATWNQLASTSSASWYYVNRLAIAPTNSQILLAATNSGIWRSANGGASWTLVNNDGDAKDIDFHPTNSSFAIASGSAGKAWYSTNGGLSWNTTSSGWSGRVEVAYAPNNPAIVYASVNQNSGEVWKSTNGGQSYTLVNTGSSYLGEQGWYGNSIWVDPTNANTLIVGGIDLWRSSNGGATLTQISQWWRAPASAHADQHAIVAPANFNGTTNTTVFFGNDGGIYKAADVYTVGDNIDRTAGWQQLNNNLGITQFYGAAGNPSSSVIVGGTQDNGTLRYSGDAEGWSTMFGGDGGFAAADPTNPNYFYGEYVTAQVHRSSDGGASAEYINGFYWFWNGVQWEERWKPAPYTIPDAQTRSANFIAPFILDPNNPNRLLVGGRSLWRTNDAKTTNTDTSGPSWASIKSPGSDRISAIAVAPGNSDIIWVGHNNGDVYKTSNGTAAAPIWTQVDNNAPNLPNRYVTRIAIDAHNANRVYVTFGGFSPDNVWYTSNGGTSWSDKSGSGATGLPDVPVRSLVSHPNNPSYLYAGTEVGVFGSADGGAHWSTFNEGPANVSVDQLFWMDDTLVAATHGRGLFKGTIGTVLITPDVRWSQVLGNGDGAVDPGETIALEIDLRNSGAQTANDVSGVLAITSGNATVPINSSAYPAIVAGATATNSTSYQVAVSPSHVCGAPLAFQQTVTYNGGVSFAHSFQIATGAPTNFSYSGPAVAIPDNNPAGADATIAVATTGVMSDVNVHLQLTHSFDNDLRISLIAPDGTQVALSTRNGGSGDNYSDTVFDDEAATSITAGSAPFTGSFKPQSPLSALDGKPISGTWKLHVADVAGSDVGTIDGWSLDIQPTTSLCTAFRSTVQLSAATYSVSEAAGTATITATLSHSSSQPIGVEYATSRGLATPGNDYTPISGTLSFAPGTTSQTFTLSLVNDTSDEPDETVGLTLDAPGNVTLGAPVTATLTIVDDDPPPAIRFSASDYSVHEAAGTAVVTVTLSAASGYSVAVDYATSMGTAAPGSDYTPISGTLTFNPGEISQALIVPIISDTNAEPNETVVLTLSAASKAVLAAPAAARLTITEIDKPLDTYIYLPLTRR